MARRTIAAPRRRASALAGLTVWAAGLGLATPVAAATATVTVSVHDAVHATVSSVTIGASVHASVRVSGGSGTPSGSVVVARYANGTCSGTATAVSPAVALSGGSVDVTGFAFATSAAGTFSFAAAYRPAAGSPYLTAAGCRSFGVARATPNMDLVIRRLTGEVVSTVPLGETVQALLIVGNVPNVPTPTGTATITVFEGSTCSGSPIASDGGVLSQGLLAQAHTFDAAGSYSFRGAYDGDTRYVPAATACVPLAVSKLTASVKAQVHDPAHRVVSTVPAGTTVHVDVVISGSAGAGSGTITISFFEGRSCSGSDVEVQASLVSGKVDGAHPQLLSVKGSYGYRVAWDGDARYLPLTSGCIAVAAEAAAASPAPIASAAPTSAPSQPPPTATAEAPASPPAVSAAPSPAPTATGVATPVATGQPGGPSAAPPASPASAPGPTGDAMPSDGAAPATGSATPNPASSERPSPSPIPGTPSMPGEFPDPASQAAQGSTLQAAAAIGTAALCGLLAAAWWRRTTARRTS